MFFRKKKILSQFLHITYEMQGFFENKIILGFWRTKRKLLVWRMILTIFFSTPKNRECQFLFSPLWILERLPKTAEAVQASQSLTMQMNHGHITGLHLPSFSLKKIPCFVRFSKIYIGIYGLLMIFWKNETSALVSRVSPEENFPSQEKCNRCSMRQEKSRKHFGDQFLSVEHLFLVF